MNEADIGRTIRWARKRAGMTQHELAAAVGMPQPSISRIEKGTVVPRTATLLALLRATGHQLAIEPIGPSADEARGTPADPQAASNLSAIGDEPRSEKSAYA